MNIAGVEIGAGFPCRTVAELSNNHNGDLNLALALIGAAKEAGADFVKVQSYTPQELVNLRGDGPAPEPWGSQGYTMATLYEQAKTPLEWLPRLFAEARRFEIPMFSSVFGRTSLAALEAVGCPAYKLARLDNQVAWLLDVAQATGKLVLVSATEPGDVRFKELTEIRGQAALLYCPPGYPVSPAEMRLPMFTYHDGPEWHPFLGLSSHCKDPLVAPIAVARGAKLLEYHFMLSWRPSTLEANVSLTEIEFRAMVESVRRTEVLLG